VAILVSRKSAEEDPAKMSAKVSNTDVSAVVVSSENASNNAPAETEDNNRLEAVDELEDHGGPAVPPVRSGWCGWGCLVLLGSFMIHVIADGIAYSFGVFVGSFVENFECSKSAVGGLESLMLGVTWGSGNIGFCVCVRVCVCVCVCVCYVIKNFCGSP